MMGFLANTVARVAKAFEPPPKLTVEQLHQIWLMEQSKKPAEAPAAPKPKRKLSPQHIEALRRAALKQSADVKTGPEISAKISASLKKTFQAKREAGLYVGNNKVPQPKPPKVSKLQKKDYTPDQWKTYIKAGIKEQHSDKHSACWIWQGPLNKPTKSRPEIGGYGLMSYVYPEGITKMRTVHRVAYELWVGPIPEGREICHWPCSNRACCNPAHLYAGTKEQNHSDRIADDLRRGSKPGFKWFTNGTKNKQWHPERGEPMPSEAEGWIAGRTDKPRKQHNGL